jgi:DnaJ-class molecular chaperone
MSQQTPTLYRETADGRVDELQLPFRYALCPSCDGRGTTTRHVEPDGGGFTASDWAEACNDDPDFPDDYFAGFYDRPCGCCDGLRVVPVVDEQQLDAATLAEWNQQLDDDADYARLRAYEQRMGC